MATVVAEGLLRDQPKKGDAARLRLHEPVWYKDVKNVIVDTASIEMRKIKSALAGTVTLDFRTSGPDTGAGGKIKGLELNAQRPLDMLPALLEGLGITSNVTPFEIGDVATVQGGRALPIPGVLKARLRPGRPSRRGRPRHPGQLFVRQRGGEQHERYFRRRDRQKLYGLPDISANFDLPQNISLTFNASNVSGYTFKRKTLQVLLLSGYDFGRRSTADGRVEF